jgi:topoisomerase IV subunit A
LTPAEGAVARVCVQAEGTGAKVFRLADGLSWRQGENRTRTETNLVPWLGARGAAGRLVPSGFPRSNRFS